MGVDILHTLPQNSVVVDVRSELEFLMYSLPNTVNIPYSSIGKNESLHVLRKEISLKSNGKTNGMISLHFYRHYCFKGSIYFTVYVLCRRGNDSQRAVSYLKNQQFDESVQFYNIKGGLHEYSKRVDPRVPIY